MTKRVIQTGTKGDWLARRQQGIGASDAPVILGLSKFKSPFQLYHEKLGLEPIPPDETEAVEWGLTLEEPLAKRFQRETGRQILPHNPYEIHQHESLDWMLASIDRWQVDPQRSAYQPLPLELKTAHYAVAQEWKDEPPLAYQVQVQHQLAVTGAPMASIAALIGGSKFVWCDVPRDEAFIAMLIEEETKFWQRLLDRNPPAVDGSTRTTETLKRLYQAETGEVIALPVEAIEWDERRQALKTIIDEANEEDNLLKNRIIAAIGNATVGQLPNGIVFTYKTQTTKAHMVKESTFRRLLRKAPK